MKQDDIRFFTSWFKGYVKSYSSTDEEVQANLNYKEEHSLRVRDLMLTLGEEQLDPNSMFLAEVIGLFHDVGRFEQYVKYHTFKDHLSEDHAELGLSILERHQILFDHMSKQEKAIIFTAIRNHNRLMIHESVRGNTLLFCKLIRDADKLDILEQIINFYENPQRTPYFAVENNHSDNRYSHEIIQGILSGRQITYSSVQYPADIKLIRVSWFLDLTLPTASKIAKRKQFLQRIKVFIPETDEINEAFRYVEQVLSEHALK
ncbi:MAG: HD domain-containing protein [Bacillota bacterium]|nr:HD domain-containing protein [Bacillota bacterium]